MHPGWLFRSEIVRATSISAQGPYTFEEVVFENRNPAYFDGRMTHNPTIRKVDNTYLLFYIGNTFWRYLPDASPILQGENPDWFHDPWTREVSTSMRIGLATSQSLEGPWKRPDYPLMQPRPGNWDNGTLVNPAPCVLEDGSIYLAYASAKPVGEHDSSPSNIGIARADNWQSPFVRVSESPCFAMDLEKYWFEDPFLWHQDGYFHLIMKDLGGTQAQTPGVGIYAYSKDAILWHWGDPVESYRKEIPRVDGVESVGNFERPSLYFDGQGTMKYLTAASAISDGELGNVTDTWVNVLALKED